MKNKLLSFILSLAMVITSFAGMTGLFPVTAMAAEPEVVVINNDGDATKITDPAFDKYFEGTAAEGVAELLDSGKCYINGIALPATEDETVAFKINTVNSLWKTENGWCYNVHKYTGDDNMKFVDARKDLFDMTSTVRGHETQLYINESGYVTAINIQSYDVARVESINPQGHDWQFTRGEFDLETNRVRFDSNDIHFPVENVDENIAVGDIIVFYFGSEEPGGTAQWHAEKATPVVGKITQPEKGWYAVSDDSGEIFKSIESNVSRYNLIDCSRPTQGYSVYTTLGITDNDIVLWNTPNGFPIGFTFGKDKAASKANLLAGIENAKALVESVQASADGKDVPDGQKWAAQEDIDAFNEAIAAAEAVANKNSSAQINIDWAMWDLRNAWDDGKGGGFIAAIAGGEEETPDDGGSQDQQDDADPNKVVWNNDGNTKITDSEFDKYFDGTAAEGVAALLAAGKCSINGLPLPATEDETSIYNINQVKSLWKTENGWCYNVHKYTGDDNMKFEDARKDLFDMTSTVRGHKTTITLDETTKKAVAINIESFDTVKIVYFEDHGGSVDKLDRGEFDLETQRVRLDFNEIPSIASANFGSDIKFGDVLCYWFGENGWNAVKAGQHVGVLTKDDETKEYIVDAGTDKEWKMIESNVSRYNLIDDTRPTQQYTAYVRMGLQEAGIPIITWVTPNDYPIGFSYGSGAKEALTKAIENAEKLLASVKVSTNGSDVPSNKKWATQAAVDEFKAAIEEAKAVNDKNSSATWDREKALYALNIAWGEGGDKPSGFVGELGDGTGAIESIFPDVTEETVGKTANAAINWAAEEGIIKGFSDGTFKPEGTCTREQFVVMIWRFAGKPAATAEVNFSDITADRNTYKAIQWAVEAGIIKGFDDGTFQPEGDTTRQQVAIMLWRMAGKSKASANVEFTDVDEKTSGFDAIQWGAEAGLIKGYNDGSFKPEADCQRQHIAIFLYRYNNNVK